MFDENEWNSFSLLQIENYKFAQALFLQVL